MGNYFTDQILQERVSLRILYIFVSYYARSQMLYERHKNPQSVDKSGFHLLFRNCILVWGIYISITNTLYEKENCS